ncbi:MAG: [Fe-Fe] hydrogenase large subunit C-terminal domain-containing protein [Candidatus Margulisiibacteriota bacterium]
MTAFRRLGFKYVFDTQFGADLTIVEEASELIHRLKNNGKLPMITSCSAAWIKFVEQFYPELLPNLSTCMSPMSMVGSLIKNYFPQTIQQPADKVFSVAAMCCTAKKDESMRPDLMTKDGLRYVDAVITTRELVWMIKSTGINFTELEDGECDSLLGESSGAGTIFGATGGVMEAAIRTAHFLVAGHELPEITFTPVRGAIEYIKEAEVNLAGTILKVAVASSLGHAQTLLEKVRSGEAQYHFIEIMGCLGGCVGGGGQPYAGTNMVPLDKELLRKRASVLYGIDELKHKRQSHNNSQIADLYNNLLEHYGSHKAHELLHRGYQANLPTGICRQTKPEQIHHCVIPEDPRFHELKQLIESNRNKEHFQSYLIPVLHKAQELFGYLSVEVMDFISIQMQIPTSRIYGVATFYHFFSLRPKGETRINVCLGTACYVKGAADVVREFEKQLGIKMGMTGPDGKYSLESTRCIGACGLAPVALINDKVHGKVKAQDVKDLLREKL